MYSGTLLGQRSACELAPARTPAEDPQQRHRVKKSRRSRSELCETDSGQIFGGGRQICDARARGRSGSGASLMEAAVVTAQARFSAAPLEARQHRVK